MKIVTDQQQAIANQISETRAEESGQAQAAATKAKAAAKPPRTADKVELSSSLTAGVQNQQELQAKRVESIKARIQAGTYQVSSRDVAEKMLADPFGL